MRISTFLFAASVFCLLTTASKAQNLQVLHAFNENAGSTDGVTPSTGVIRDSKGNVYGTTLNGGTWSWGTVFRLSPQNKEVVLYNFTGGFDGRTPSGGLLQGIGGALFGVTSEGGDFELGSVFKVDGSGSESILYSFKGGTQDGCLPSGTLITDTAGSLYGTAESCGSSNYGIVFKIDGHGNEAVLHSFGGGSDGAYPLFGVTRDTAGNIYGTTGGGGPGNFGTIFKIDTAGNETVLYAFSTGLHGEYPGGGVVRDAAGNLYGTTQHGGGFGGGVYKLDAAGNYIVLHAFSVADGNDPSGNLLLDAAGNLYGTTIGGGDLNQGVIFKLDAAGNETLLYSFTGGLDGKYPTGNSLVIDNQGNMYGTTRQGGLLGGGVVFKLEQ